MRNSFYYFFVKIVFLGTGAFTVSLLMVFYNFKIDVFIHLMHRNKEAMEYTIIEYSYTM